MPDLVKPLKLESLVLGTQTDGFPTETNPTEDYTVSKGVAFEDDTTLIDKNGQGVIQFTDSEGIRTIDSAATKAAIPLIIALG